MKGIPIHPELLGRTPVADRIRRIEAQLKRQRLQSSSAVRVIEGPGGTTAVARARISGGGTGTYWG